MSSRGFESDARPIESRFLQASKPADSELVGMSSSNLRSCYPVCGHSLCSSVSCPPLAPKMPSHSASGSAVTPALSRIPQKRTSVSKTSREHSQFITAMETVEITSGLYWPMGPACSPASSHHSRFSLALPSWLLLQRHCMNGLVFPANRDRVQFKAQSGVTFNRAAGCGSVTVLGHSPS